jgi:hypothetical protein
MRVKSGIIMMIGIVLSNDRFDKRQFMFRRVNRGGAPSTGRWAIGWLSRPVAPLIVLLLLIPVGTGRAQDAPPDAAVALALEYGISASGTIDERTPSVIYTFEGLRGDLVGIDLRVTGGDLIPLLTLVDSGGGVVALRTGAGSAIAIRSLRLPASDRYFLIVGRFGYAVGTTGGSYTLSLERRGASSLSGSALRYGDTVINTISDDAPQAYYTFRAEPGDVVTVRMQRMSGNLDPALLITDSAGVIVAENDDMFNPANPGTLDAQIAGLTLPEGGVYVIIATRFGGEMGASQGTFVLTLERGTGVTLGRTARTPIPLQPGQTAQGEITASRFEVWYRFDGRAGQTVTIRAVRASGDLDPLIQLLDGDQTVLSENDDSEGTQNSRIAGFVLPADGPYLILVTRYQRAAGTTTGAFTLSLER